MDTALLFGGRSFLGGHICRVLVNRGYNVLLHSRSTADFRNLQDIIPDAAIEPVVCDFDELERIQQLCDRSQFVIYAAIPYYKQSIGQSETFRKDLIQLESILNIIAASKVKKSVFVSVSGTIGRVSGGCSDETHEMCEDAAGGWGHVKQKLASESLILQHAKDGLRAVIVNPSMCIGEFDTKPSTGEIFRFFSLFPFSLMPEKRVNIVDVEDVAMGTVLALEKGVSGQRYILSGTNTTMGALIRRIKKLKGKPTPRFTVSRWMAVLTAYLFEVLNMIARRPTPVVPLLGIELIEHGSQHLTCEKAMKDLGFKPRDAWTSVDRSYHWYVKHGIL